MMQNSNGLKILDKKTQDVYNKFFLLPVGSMSNQFCSKTAAVVDSHAVLILIWQIKLKWINVLCRLCRVHINCCSGMSAQADTRSAQLRPLSSQVIWQWGDFPTNLLLTILWCVCVCAFFPLTASESGRGWRQPVRVSQSHAAPANHQSGKPLLIGHH